MCWRVSGVSSEMVPSLKMTTVCPCGLAWGWPGFRALRPGRESWECCWVVCSEEKVELLGSSWRKVDHGNANWHLVTPTAFLDLESRWFVQVVLVSCCGLVAVGDFLWQTARKRQNDPALLSGHENTETLSPVLLWDFVVLILSPLPHM